MNRRFIRISKNEQKIANLLVQQQLIATVYGVVRLYTDLVALYEDVKVKEETLASAEKLYADTKAEVDEGTQAPIELTRANAQVYSIRQDLIDSRGLLEEQEAIVKNVITRRTDNDPEVLNARIIPTDSIEVPAADETRPLQDLLTLAFANRPDLTQAGVQVENSQISLQGSRNGLRPEIDLVGVAQNNALAGQLNPLSPAWHRFAAHRRLRQCARAACHAQVSNLWRRPQYHAAAAQPDRSGRCHARRDPAPSKPGPATTASQAGAARSRGRADRHAPRARLV